MTSPLILKRIIRDREQIFTFLNIAMSYRGTHNNARNQKGLVFYWEKMHVHLAKIWYEGLFRPLNELEIFRVLESKTKWHLGYEADYGPLEP